MSGSGQLWMRIYSATPFAFYLAFAAYGATLLGVRKGQRCQESSTSGAALFVSRTSPVPSELIT